MLPVTSFGLFIILPRMPDPGLCSRVFSCGEFGVYNTLTAMASPGCHFCKTEVALAFGLGWSLRKTRDSLVLVGMG